MSGPPDMADIVEEFAFAVTLRNYPATTTKDADGYRVIEAPVDTPARAHVYPAPGKTTEQGKGEGQRAGTTWAGGTITEVRAATEDGARATEILWGGRVCEVTKVSHYVGPDGTGGYYEFEAREVQR